jgi:hypothetical protein
MAQEIKLEETRAISIFDAIWYVKEYPDVVRSGLDPAEHYRKFGRRLGRRPCAKGDEHGLNVRHVIAKEIQFSPSDEVALLVTHAPAGRLRPHVLPYMKQLKGSGLLVLLIVVVDRPLEMLDEEISTADGIIVRDNGGYDFGAWAHGLRLFPALFDINLLIMTNDSVIPTDDVTVFRAMTDRLRSCQADIVGLTANHELGWHVQSYFLGIKRGALTSLAFRDFIYSVRRIDDKDQVIRTYEVPFAADMTTGGLTVEALFHGPYPNNPVVWSWRELIENQFPFIKLLLLRKIMYSFAPDDHQELDNLHETWPNVLQSAGFDVDLVRSCIRSADMSWFAEGPRNDLLMNPKKFL